MQTHRNLYTGIHFTISILDLFLQKKYQFDFFPALSLGAACVICREHLPNICVESYHPGRWNTLRLLLRFFEIVDTDNNSLSIIKVSNLKGPFYLPVWLVRRAIQLSTIINGSIYICSCDTHLVCATRMCALHFLPKLLLLYFSVRKLIFHLNVYLQENNYVFSFLFFSQRNPERRHNTDISPTVG